MPGLAQTNDFMLGTATIMIGKQADLYDLNPAMHSIGLVKNFTITSEPEYTELTQGTKNRVVASVMTNNPVRCTMEAYEFTAKNFAYALGIEGAADMVAQTISSTSTAAVTALATAISVTSATGMTAGKYLMIIVDNEDNFVVRKIVSVATNTITVDKPLPAIAATGVTVRLVNLVNIGAKDDQPYYAAKIAGKLASGEQVVLMLPKIRIVRGFNMAFKSDNFGNLPIEFTIYDLVTSDAFYADFGGAAAQLFKK